MRRYKTASCSTLSGAPIRRRIGSAARLPITVKSTPERSATEMTVCTALLIALRCPAPMRFPITTFAPTESPIKRLRSSEITGAFDPTAAIA